MVISDSKRFIFVHIQKTAGSSIRRLLQPYAVEAPRTRLNRLINEEFIQIVAVSNPIKLGFKIVGNIRIHVEIKKMDRIIKELKKLKPLWFIVQTTGGTGIDTEFVVKSLDELNELIFEKINKIDGVIKTETSLFLKYIKRQYDWGTALY